MDGLASDMPRNGAAAFYGAGVADDAAVEALREDITRALDAQLAQLEQLILELETHARMHELDISDTLAPLKTSQAAISALREHTGNAVHIAELRALSVVAPIQIAAAQASVSDTRAQAGYQVSMMMHEMTEAKLQALETRLAAEAAEFSRYEERSSARIEELAARNGVDLTTYRDIRDDYIRQREKAERRGDRSGALLADYGLAVNNVEGLAAAGASEDEIERARKEAEAALQRYLAQVEIDAAREASAQGLTGDAAAAHVAQARAAAEDRAHAETGRITERYMAEVEINAVNEAAELGLSGDEAEAHVAQARAAAQERMDEVVADAEANYLNWNTDRQGVESRQTDARAASTDEDTQQMAEFSVRDELWAGLDLPLLEVADASLADPQAPSTIASGQTPDDPTPILAVADADNDDKQPAIGGKGQEAQTAIG